jgi:hypothetical protein
MLLGKPVVVYLFKKLPAICWNGWLIAVFTRACYIFYSKELLALHPIFSLMVHALLMACYCLFIVFAATFHVLSLFHILIVFIT